MEEVMLTVVRSYILIWTGIIIVVLLGLWYYYNKFEKKHPEFFLSNKKDEHSPDGENLKRQYRNMGKLIISTPFIWMIGIALIFLYFEQTRVGWFMLIFPTCILLWILLSWQRKPKNKV